MRFSIAHEIAHTFFPDCAENVRLRHQSRTIQGNDWQLEMLCNVGAAELIMPVGTLAKEVHEDLTIEDILQIRKQYDVSTEAVLIRTAKLADFPCAAFCASRRDGSVGDGAAYRLDYVIPSRTWRLPLLSGTSLPEDTAVAECIAIGFTAKATETWGDDGARVHVECVGLPGYPGSRVPRVAGILRSLRRHSRADGIKYVIGDALSPRGKGRKIIAQVVNDRTPNWGGGGFAAAVRRKWPDVQHSFRQWAIARKSHLQLGEGYNVTGEKDIDVFCMVVQKGFGPSETPRIRYAALERCLETLASQAADLSASVHMPRIGTGHAGGSWQLIEELITSTVVTRGVPVTVYDPPGRPGNKPADFFLSGAGMT